MEEIKKSNEDVKDTGLLDTFVEIQKAAQEAARKATAPVGTFVDIQTGKVSAPSILKSELREKEARAISILKSFEPENEPYYLCYSGGKDSDCIRILAELAGVKFDTVHNLTTVDAPETVQYIKSIPNIIIDKAHYPDGRHKTMWNLIRHKHLPPTRVIRYCCSELKEQGGKGRLKITGVRKAESVKRKQNGGLVKVLGKEKTMLKLAEELGAEYDTTQQGGIVMNMDNDENRRMVEQCYRTTSTMVNPITDWTDEDVWEFLHHHGCRSNPLYECNLKRIGCVGCPLSGGKNQKREFIMYPKIRDNYIRAFAEIARFRYNTGKYLEDENQWKNGVDVLKWWVGDDLNQLSFIEEEYLKDIPDNLLEPLF